MARGGSAAKNLSLQVNGTARDLGELQYNVLLCVTEKRYEDATKLLTNYQKMKSTGPYDRRTLPIFQHAEELVHAIETKKNFPNMTALTQGKQEEIHQKTLENWEDLKICLRRLRTIERDMSTEDARSSIWVIKAVIFSFVVSLTVFVLSEGFRSFGGSFLSFMKDTFQVGVDSVSFLF